MKLHYEGLRATAKYLTVYVKAEMGEAIQFKAVRVPIEALMAEEVTDALDTAVRRRLIEHWSGVDIADPLF